ncbi:transmembrane channel-like protein 5 [Babylonia areolata]|uniref:transmembrane channel-like protein 5 n=1 Tax=Babylonia areolata TaxID=304850 RepID=UPI003FD1C1DE
MLRRSSNKQDESIPMHHYNPAFLDASLERGAELPPEGTQYEFAGYGYPSNQPVRNGMPEGNQQHLEGEYVVAHGKDADYRYGTNQNLEDSMAMENLLKRLPSRQLESAAASAAKTLQSRQSHKRSGSRQSEDYLNDMLDSGSLDVEDEEKMEEAIRSMPTSMADRRSMIRKWSSRKKRTPGVFKRMKYSFGMAWKHFKDNLAELKYTLQLWHSHMKKIEGNFGTDVLSYFLFLKWLLLINIPTLLLTLGFIVVPQILFRWFQQEHPGFDTNEDFTGLELLTGAGWFSPTELYYGYYTNKTISISDGKMYKMQVAYLLTCGGYYLLTLLIMGHSILRSYRKYYIEAGGFRGMHIVFRILGSWDFGLTSAEAVKLKHKSTFNEIKEYLAGATRKQERKKLSDWCQLFWLRVVTNIIVLGLMGGAGYLIYYLSENQETYSTSSSSSTTTLSQDSAEDPLLLLVLPFSIGGIHLVLPFVFTIIEGFEKYESPITELYIHIIRSVLMRVATLTVLVLYWYEGVARSASVKCWETIMGQELYRLVIVDFIFTLFSTFFSEFIRRLLAGRVARLEHPTFNIGRNTVELIYSQALCWLGTFYAPLLSLIVIVKLIIVFYVKMVSVLQNCKPSERPWRATRSHTIFLGFLFIFFLLTTAAVFCGIIFVQPSRACGPYQGKDKMYSVVPELVDSWSSDYPWLTSVINFIASPGFIAAILIVLGMGVYLIRTIMVGRKETVQRLKQQLVLEGKDKTFLLNLLNQVSQRQSLTMLHTDRRLQQQQPPENLSSPGGRVFVRRIAESAAVAK